MSGKTDYSKIRQKFLERQKFLAEIEDERWWKPPQPTSGGPDLNFRIRILPPPDGFDSWWVEYGIHYRIKNESSQPVQIVCPQRTIGKPCPICEFTRGLWKSGVEQDQNLARDIGVKTRYISNIIVLSENPSEVKIWSYGTMVWTFLNNLCIGGKGDIIPIDDPVSGYDLRLSVSMRFTKIGNIPNYTIIPEMKPCPIPDKNLLSKIHPIHEIIRKRVKSYDEIRSILYGSSEGESGSPSSDDTEDVAISDAPAIQEDSIVEDAPRGTDPTVVVEKAHAQSTERAESGHSAQAARPTQEELVRRAKALLKANKTAK